MKTPILLLAATLPLCAQTVGMFEGHSDIGTVLHPGTTTFDAAKSTYSLTGSGANIWGTEDAFQFAWRKVTGDFTFTADVAIVTPGDPNRKAEIMLRRSLDKDSDYVSAVLHGGGLAALQTRSEKAGPTGEIISLTKSPARMSLVRRNGFVYMMVAAPGEPLRPAGGSFKLAGDAPFYLGFAACAHNKDATVQVTFSNVKFTQDTTAPATLYSSVETIPLAGFERTAVYVAQGRVESPFWMKDGKSMLVTSGGKLNTLTLTGTLTPVNTATAARIGHHTAISPDGTTLGFTDDTPGKAGIYTVPVAGGTPKLITSQPNSWFQGWSPDSKTVILCGTRNGKTQVVTLPAEGGTEALLGTPNNNNDSPEYSPDGKFIYFNSDRTGLMQIWRMTADGKDETQLTADDFSNWFPHISPNGQQVAYMSYDKGVAGHPNDVGIQIHSMTLATKAVKSIASLMGSPASFHSAAWSPDSQTISLVSYQQVQQQ